MRGCEWVIAIFFSWVTALSFAFPISRPMHVRVVAVNLAIAAVYAILLRNRNLQWTDYARDWLPQALAFVAYKEMGWFASGVQRGTLEQKWILWDRWLLNGIGLRSAIEAAGVVLPGLLEVSYSLVYTVPPLTMALLYRSGLRSRADTLLTTYLIGLFLCYGQFPFWPSEPPRTVFPGQDMPGVSTVFRRFSLWLVGSYGIHTSVFPSAHVSGVFAAAFGVAAVMPGRRLMILGYLLYAVLVTLATVYGRYHYAVDAVAGFAAGAVALPLAILLISRTQPPARLPYPSTGAAVAAAPSTDRAVDG